METNKTLCVVGSRRWNDSARLWSELDRLAVERGPFGQVVTGFCKGACRAAARWAEARGLPFWFEVANWQRWGNAAGKRRSVEMIRGLPAGSIVAAFVPEELSGSVGTCFEVELARKAGFPVWLVSSARGSSWFCEFPKAEEPSLFASR